MRLVLTEIPEEGKHFKLNRNTAELNDVLKDLIGSQAYEAQFYVRPLNLKDYEITGSIETKLPETCGRCGLDIKLDLKTSFHEILIPKQEDDRTGKYVRPNHLSDLEAGGPDTSEYVGKHFDMGEYLHEVVALAAPFNPVGPEKDNGDCGICEKPVSSFNFTYDEEIPEDPKKNPFSALKGLKLN